MRVLMGLEAAKRAITASRRPADRGRRVPVHADRTEPARWLAALCTSGRVRHAPELFLAIKSAMCEMQA